MDSELKQAYKKRLISMRRWLVLIVAAALACVVLYRMDSAKTNFEKQKSTPLLVDSLVKAQLHNAFIEVAAKKADLKLREDDRKKAAEPIWKDIETFIIEEQYTAESEFINKVAARISAEQQANEFVTNETFKRCVANALNPPTEVKELVVVFADPKTCTDEYVKQNKANTEKAEKRIASVYRYFKEVDLKAEAQTAWKRADVPVDSPPVKNVFDSSIQFMLNEEGETHIVYQILRIALIVIIVFALLAFAVLFLTTIMLSDGIKVLTDQATQLIGTGKSAIGPATRAGVLSVAALGVGGGYIAGAATGPSAPEGSTYRREGATRVSPKPAPGKGGPGDTGSTDPTRPNETNYDGDNIVYALGDSGNIYDYSKRTTTVTGENPLPPTLKVDVYPDVRILDREDKPSNLTLDPDIARTIEDYLLKLTDINEKMGNPTTVSTLLNDNIRVGNSTKLGDDALTIQDSQKDPLLIRDVDGQISQSITGVQRNLNSIQGVADSLDNLQANSLDRPAQPKERSRISSLLRGSDKYFVSKRSLQQLEDLVNETEAELRIEKAQLHATSNDSLKNIQAADLDRKIIMDEVILEALKLLYLQGGKPIEKAKLVDQLETKINLALSRRTDDSCPKLTEVLGRLRDHWQQTILTYTRIG